MNHVRYSDELSWCGETLDSNFHFKDIEQAIINNRHGERVICRCCMSEIVSYLVARPRRISNEETID